MSCCQYVALLTSMLTVFAPNEWKVEYFHVFQLQYQIQLFKLSIYLTVKLRKHISVVYRCYLQVYYRT